MLFTAFLLYKSNQILSVNQRIAFLYLRNRYRERYRFAGRFFQAILNPFSQPAGPVISIGHPAFAKLKESSTEHHRACHYHWFLLLKYDGQ